MKQRLATMWRAVPTTLRRTIVAVIGATLVVLGIALIVFTGTFSLFPWC